MVSKGTKRSAKRVTKISRSDRSEQEVEEWLKFFNIELKTDEEIEKMSKQERLVYKSRADRWERLMESEIDFQIFKSLHLFKHLNSNIAEAFDKIEEIKNNPNYQQDDEEYKNMIETVQFETQDLSQELVKNREDFDDIYIPYKKFRSEERERRVKQELIDIKNIKQELESDSDIEIKEEYVSEEDEDSKQMDNDYTDDDEIQVKEEYVSEDSDVDDKDLIKKQIKTEFDIKQEIKTEIKSEIKTEIKEELKVEIKEELEEFYSDFSED